jgi:hypothetical protein
MIKLSRRQFIATTALGASVPGIRSAQSATPERVFDFTQPLDGWETVAGNWTVENIPGASREDDVVFIVGGALHEGSLAPSSRPDIGLKRTDTPTSR